MNKVGVAAVTLAGSLLIVVVALKVAGVLIVLNGGDVYTLPWWLR